MNAEDIKKRILIEFVEKGADIEHARWARWQEYLHSLCTKNKDGSLTISKERVVHWEKEIATPYSELTEELKEYDRKETRNYIPLVEKALDQAMKEASGAVIPDYEEKELKQYLRFKESTFYNGFIEAIAKAKQKRLNFLRRQ